MNLFRAFRLTPEPLVAPPQPGPRRSILYSRGYFCLLLAASLDVLVTWSILNRGGYEANQVAAAVMHRLGFSAMVIYKFMTIAVVMSLCEWIGRLQWRTGYRLVWFATLVTMVPVLIGLYMHLSSPHMDKTADGTEVVWLPSGRAYLPPLPIPPTTSQGRQAPARSTAPSHGRWRL